MDYNLYNTIKILKKLSTSGNTTYVSSGELAEELGVSQQTASRFIIELSDKKYIERTLQSRKQKITLLEPSLDILYSELNQLNSILEMDQELNLTGEIKSGMGEGKYYISQEPYMAQFREKLHISPYPGTLNIKIHPEFENILRRIRGADGIHIDGFKDKERTFGGVKCFPGKIDGTATWLIFPERSSYTDVVEIISDKFLRRDLQLHDGDELNIRVTLDH
jgi:Transcriptional regulator of a riboflavin/FAD biosynthetic operon